MRKLKNILCFVISGVGLILTSFSHAQGYDYFHGNVISSSNGALLTFSDSAFAEGIGKPLFTRGGNLINLAIKFFPVFLLIAFFGISLSAIKNVGKVRKEKKDKDLDNK